VKTTTEKLAVALHILARDIQSDDGVANAAILEAAVRLRQQQLRIKSLEEALRRIANQDYRGNRSTESQIAFDALKEAKP
jgi:hypothetical protein